MFDALLHALAAAVASFVTVPLAIRGLARTQVIDVPNERSSHTIPVPRGGGIGMLVPWLVGVTILLVGGDLALSGFALALTIGVIGMAVVGFVDDVKTLPALPRLIVEGALVAVCLWMGDVTISSLALPGIGSVELGVLGLPAAWLFVVGFTNMFNFMDGINGLAGFQTLLGAGGLAVISALSGDMTLALPMALLAGASIGFLRFNFPRASVFMGDVGSLPIGFALAMAVLRVHGHGGLPLWVPVLMIWPFLFDATYTLVNRVVRKRNPFRAHRSHVYQRLVVAGWSHTRVTLLYTGLALVCSSAAVLVDRDILEGSWVFWPLLALTLIWTIATVSQIRAART